MRYKKSGYYGSVCRSWDWTWIGIHLDTWQKRWHLGFGLWGSSGREREHQSDAVKGGIYRQRHGLGGYLDINPPLGEPNRAGMHGKGWSVVLGLPSMRSTRDTGRKNRGVPVWETCLTWPHIDGCSRYKYHQDAAGKWVRNDRPEPLHWGWLTISRRR